jgi:hypothetical protein
MTVKVATERNVNRGEKIAQTKLCNSVAGKKEDFEVKGVYLIQKLFST